VAATGSASTRPAAAGRGVDTAGSGSIRASIRSQAASGISIPTAVL